MLRIERHDKILTLLQKYNSMTVDSLAEHFYVSPATIRRDLNELAHEKLIKRTYGGAVLLHSHASESPLLLRENENVEAKQCIAKLAMQFVQDNSIIMMDSSSTVMRIIPYLEEFDQITCITHGLRTVFDLQKHRITAHCLGGKLQPSTLSCTGASTCRRIEELNADITILSCRGFSAIHGMTEASENEAQIKRSMINAASKSILLCDHTKFDILFLETVCKADALHAIITDQKPSSNDLERLQNHKIQLIYPDESKSEL